MRFQTGDIVKLTVPLGLNEPQDETEWTVLRTEHIWQPWDGKTDYAQRLAVGVFDTNGNLVNTCTGFRNTSFTLVRRAAPDPLLDLACRLRTALLSAALPLEVLHGVFHGTGQWVPDTEQDVANALANIRGLLPAMARELPPLTEAEKAQAMPPRASEGAEG